MTNMAGLPPQSQRLHGLDAMRLLLMLLGIPYHAALIYNVDPGWIIHSRDTSSLLTNVSIVLHSFRLGAFFILAGFFASIVEVRQGSGVWLKGKMIQLGVPLLACALLLTPPQIFIAALATQNQPMQHLREALDAVLVVASHPSKLWVLHLWFLIDLLLICAAFGLCARAVASPPVARWLDSAERFAVRYPSATLAALLCVFLAMTLGIQLFHMALHVHEVSLLSGLIQVQSTLYYGAFFLLGVALQRRRGLLNWFQSFSAANLVVAIVAPVLCVMAARSASHLAQTSLMFFQSISAICIARVLFWAAMRFMQQPNRGIKRGADAAFTVYLIHHPIVAALGFLCLWMQFPPLLAWSGIVVLTTILSLGFHDLFITRSTVLGFLLNGRLAGRGLGAAVGRVAVVK